jgi:Flp pilus assembly protein TadG
MDAMMLRLAKYLKDTRGVAAVEMVFILPVLLVLYIGMIDVTAIISIDRRVTYAASAVADLVTQNDTSVKATDITDYFNAAEMVMDPLPMSGVRVEVYQYRLVSGAVINQWSRKSTTGTACTAPVGNDLKTLMAEGNDLIVAVVCTSYDPSVAQILGKTVLGSTTYRLNEQIALRPRTSTTLSCVGC